VNEYILLMHDDVTDEAIASDGARWAAYFRALGESGCFDGGSAIGTGESVKRGCPASPARTNPTGFIRVRAQSLEAAKAFVVGNPVYDGGGTIDVRELPRDADARREESRA